MPYPPDPYSIPSNAPWISVPVNPTSTFLTFAGPSHNLGAETSQHFLANPTTNSINQIPQYGNIAPSADDFNNPDVLENLPMEETPSGDYRSSPTLGSANATNFNLYERN